MGDVHNLQGKFKLDPVTLRADSLSHVRNRARCLDFFKSSEENFVSPEHISEKTEFCENCQNDVETSFFILEFTDLVKFVLLAQFCITH